MKEGRRISFFLLLSSFSLSVFFILYVRKEAGGGEVLEKEQPAPAPAILLMDEWAYEDLFYLKSVAYLCLF